MSVQKRTVFFDPARPRILDWALVTTSDHGMCAEPRSGFDGLSGVSYDRSDQVARIDEVVAMPIDQLPRALSGFQDTTLHGGDLHPA